jgi:hypothetical protein
MTEAELHAELLEVESRTPRLSARPAHALTEYAALARDATWRQKWDAGRRAIAEEHEVTGRVWSDAIERCLADHGAVFIPRLDGPIYLDRPIVMRSGQRLVAEPDADIRLKQGAGGACMLRNAGVRFGQHGPIRHCEGADEDIRIEGGLWSDQANEGRGRGGWYDERNSLPGAQGVFLLHNVTRVSVRNARFRDCSCFAVQLGNARDFVVDGVTFDETADGVHIEGPSDGGIIRRVRGKTNDDAVALNAWDWDNSSLSFGPIANVLVEDVECRPGYVWSEIRLLPGTKVFPGGERVACDIRRCLLRDLRGIHTLKLYDQPNISRPEADYSDPIGRAADLFFADLVLDGIPARDYYDPSSDGAFDLCADVEGLSIRNVRLNYVPGRDGMAPYLLSAGPKAVTWPRPGAGGGWIEVFNPNANPVVRGLRIRDVRLPADGPTGPFVRGARLAALVHERRTRPNPDFPRTLPRGGNGAGRIVDPDLD